MDEKFKINTDDTIFTINANNIPLESSTYRYGNEDNSLEIVATNSSKCIQYIGCMYIDEVYSDSIILPGYKECEGIELAQYEYMFHTSDRNDFVSDFTLNLNDRELDIVFSNNCYPCYYYLDDRLEYYFDEFKNLIYIKVVDLTEEEYNYFKR